MKDPVPGTLKHPPKEENLKQEVDEDQYATDTGITCPMIGIRPNSFNVIAPDGANCQTLMDVTEHHTLPIPIFLPTSVKCGNGKHKMRQKKILVNISFLKILMLEIQNVLDKRKNYLKLLWNTSCEQ